MRSASVGWAGVIPHALSKEKMEEKRKPLKKGKDRETRGDHLGGDRRMCQKKGMKMSCSESSKGENYHQRCISKTYKEVTVVTGSNQWEEIVGWREEKQEIGKGKEKKWR